MSKAQPSFRGRPIAWWITVIAIVVAAYLLRDYFPASDQRADQQQPNDASSVESLDPDKSPYSAESFDRGPADGQDLPGQLRRAGKDVFESPAGLRYVPGSREGHRLQHILLHAKDQPERPGSHGVFDGGEDATIRVIDEAYRIAQQRGPPTRIERDGSRTIYTVDLGRRIGFVGGQTGKRTRHPACQHVRIVLEGDRIITAFPLRP